MCRPLDAWLPPTVAPLRVFHVSHAHGSQASGARVSGLDHNELETAWLPGLCNLAGSERKVLKQVRDERVSGGAVVLGA